MHTPTIIKGLPKHTVPMIKYIMYCVSPYLLIDQKASDRPDLTVRVFRIKLGELLSDILEKHIFGRPLAHVYTI